MENNKRMKRGAGSYIKWEELHKRIVKLAGTMTGVEVAKTLQVPEHNLRQYCGRMGISLKYDPGWSVRKKQSEDEKIKAESEADIITHLVADLFDVEFNSRNPVDECIRFLNKKIEL